MPSKSSIYTLALLSYPDDLGFAEIKYANSVLKEIFDVVSVLILGKIFTSLVRTGASELYIAFTPKIVLLTGSMP